MDECALRLVQKTLHLFMPVPPIPKFTFAHIAKDSWGQVTGRASRMKIIAVVAAPVASERGARQIKARDQ